MISEDRVEAAVEYLRDTAKQYGQARGRAMYTENNLRPVKALNMPAEQKATPVLPTATPVPTPTPQVEIPIQGHAPLSDDLKTGIEDGGSPMRRC